MFKKGRFMDRYSKIINKNSREIVLLKAFPCVWGKCSFCDYIDDKETEEKGIGECIIAKQRNGPVGTVKMAWIGAHSKFADLELVHKE